MDHDRESYSKLLDKEYPKSFHDSETVSLLDENDFQHQRSLPRSRIGWVRQVAVALLVVVAVAYVFGSLVIMTMAFRHGEYRLRAPDPPYSPLADIVRYKTMKSADGYDEDLQGFPSEAHDNAWIKLVEPALSRISYEEMELGREDAEHSVAVGDGDGGYMGSLGVFHELHCLRRLKLYLHKEHYYPKLTHGSEEDTYELNHLNHCLEAIRLSLMCAGNTALYSFQWPDSNEKVRKPKTKTNSERTCVDWNLIEDWAHNRSIGMNPRLMRPAVPHDHEHMQHNEQNRS